MDQKTVEKLVGKIEEAIRPRLDGERNWLSNACLSGRFLAALDAVPPTPKLVAVPRFRLCFRHATFGDVGCCELALGDSGSSYLGCYGLEGMIVKMTPRNWSGAATCLSRR